MKFPLAYITIASTATIVVATSCTSDNALSWPYTAGETGTDCNGDATCEALAAEGQCNSLSLIDDSDTTCVEKLKKLKRDVALDCTPTESCLFFVDNSLLCLDQTTGEYHDDVGGNGNAITGVYTGPDGTVQTITSVTAEPTTSTAGTATRDSACAVASTTRATTSQTATSFASARSSSASSTSLQSSTTPSSTSQSASAAAQTGAAARQVIGHVGVLAVAAMPIFLAVV